MIQSKSEFDYINRNRGYLSLTFEASISPVLLQFPLTYNNELYDLFVSEKDIFPFVVSLIKRENSWFTICGETPDGSELYVMINRDQTAELIETPAIIMAESFFEDVRTNRIATTFIDESFEFMRECGLRNIRKKYYEAEDLLSLIFNDFSYIDKKRDEQVTIHPNGEITRVSNSIEEEGTHVVGVRFSNQVSGYYNYIGDNRVYNIGDRVSVPTSNNGIQIGTVVFKKIYKPGETLPYYGMKRVIGKEN